MPSEQSIQQHIRITCSTGATRLFRNNTGTLKDQHGRPVQFGLCKGSADLIGWKQVTVTPEMVGQQVAVFLSIEVKTPTGRIRPEQQAVAGNSPVSRRHCRRGTQRRGCVTVDHGGAWCIVIKSGAIPASTAPRQMNTLATGLEALVTTIGTAERVITAFQALRDRCSEEEWDELTSNGPLSDLLDACGDLEWDLEH
jgi:hypothetical protein